MRSATAVSNDLLSYYLNGGANIAKPDVTPRLARRHRRIRHVRPAPSPHLASDSTSRPHSRLGHRGPSPTPTHPEDLDGASRRRGGSTSNRCRSRRGRPPRSRVSPVTLAV